MKKLLIISTVICTLFAVTSCQKDELDLKNPNALTTDQFWVTPDDAEKGVNAIYAMFYKDGLWARWVYFRLDLTSDEGFSQSPWVELADWTRFGYINYNFWEGNSVTWRDTYKAIFRANQVLANVPDIEFSDENRKQQLLGEAKFLRALHYYYAGVLWENVPLVLEPSKPDDLHPQNTKEEVFAQVEQDLTEAFAALPEAWDAAQTGRPTKGAAKAMLAKLYMQQHRWEDAKSTLEYLIKGEGAMYSLVDHYEDNFTHLNENNSESVYEIQFGDQRRGGTGEGQDASVSTTRAQFFAPRGIGWSDGQARFWLVNAFKQEQTSDGKIDERLRYSLFYPDLFKDFGDKIYGRDWEWGDQEAWFRKYQRDYYRENEDYYSEVNFRLIRYADVLLRYAEVLNELGMTSDAYQYVDMVRARANMAPLATAYPGIGNNREAFLNRLKTERVLELSGESVRWEDLKRWGDLEDQASVDEIAERDPDFENFEVGKHLRLPIPQVEVENNPNLEQNPGY
ncbi:RagB/SusD family nutrient uptake outer membrane protein [Sinomicrobium weinanense]|uniref:RagB/SusD family nutrient uptake outer membrane protein n=1 Tax=Sinomicrobium weinanense TaxID=2842200 RepID=A0A926JTU0_9FLAO|nr:RagB/SusD family nutrient uptake outer membrane protein [Sinomicrobium weinanense]MBC9797127.1 RagB/SusD family nutrient uptake outer membrane protein [Sinomicrobium weinanense]MBU3124828.1 RagB/SusD family nutrient uptake outer membrane protein [Sinomicrobium weinanense]